MNIAAVSPLAKRDDDFALLQSTLQSGNLSAAQGAYAAFQQDVQKTSLAGGSQSLFSPGTKASGDLQAVGANLRSSNIQGAQKAFATLMQDIQSAGHAAATPPATHGHHPLSQAEIANNGVALPSAASLQTVRSVLGSKI